ncbi:MAG: glutathione S-transferase protein [Deltaproteobacteria bacterium]|nr:glutathione S-transferase protein [Deltaproteobacteria bacterium]
MRTAASDARLGFLSKRRFVIGASDTPFPGGADLSAVSKASGAPWILWGSTLSPFALKVEAMLRFAGVPLRWLPAQGRFAEALRFERRRRALIRGRIALSWPERDPQGEFPLVPFLFGPRGENLYDSSAIGVWLDAQGWTREAPLLPRADATLHFAVRLVDEALDEVGLYLAHHNRWVVSARDNDAGARLAREMRPLLGPLAPLLGRSFPARQVRRLPYLFSVAPGGAQFADLPARLRPPRRFGFPPTHALLDGAYALLVSALEPLLGAQPFLFGERFTIADASVYGQLAMNRADPSADARLRHLAPAVHGWVERIAHGEFRGHRRDGRLALAAAHAPLLAWIADTFVPLMQQNHDAFEQHRARGETRFNERAFDAGRALYDGVLCGHPFRSVAKSFQVRVWRALRREWDALATDARAQLATLLPAAVELDRDGFAAGTEIIAA